MFYMFKITKTGLKYLGVSPVEKKEKNVLYATESDLGQIAIDSITNIKDIKDLKGII